MHQRCLLHNETFIKVSGVPPGTSHSIQLSLPPVTTPQAFLSLSTLSKSAGAASVTPTWAALTMTARKPGSVPAVSAQQQRAGQGSHGHRRTEPGKNERVTNVSKSTHHAGHLWRISGYQVTSLKLSPGQQSSAGRSRVTPAAQPRSWSGRTALRTGATTNKH